MRAGVVRGQTEQRTYPQVTATARRLHQSLRAKGFAMTDVQVAAKAAPTVPVATVQSKFDEDMTRAFQLAGPDDVARAKQIALADAASSWEDVTGPVAAVLFQQFNGTNRDFSIAKARDFESAMKRHEWKRHHQGLAFDAEGMLIDGQHRTAAVALSGVTVNVLVSRKLDRNIIDAIDQSKARKAHEALQIAGIGDPQEKERIARATMEYVARVQGQSVKPTVIQLEEYVVKNDDTLSEAIRMAKVSSQNIAEPCMSLTLAAQIAHLMQLGQWPTHLIPGFLTTLQAGVEQKEHGVIVPTAKLMLAARRKETDRSKMTRDEQLATILKAAQHWAKGESVAKFKPVKGRDKLVDYHVTDEIVSASQMPEAA